MKHLLLLAVWLLSLAVMCPAVAAPPSGSILLRNVSLVNPGSDQPPLKVNILLKNGILDLMTGDPVPRSEAGTTYDAAGGFIMGNLKLGEPANFMVLNGDPRQDIDILLDTKTHATFAARQGEVVLNVYPPVLSDSPAEATARGWLAYSPPPLAVPLDYANTGKWNRWQGKYVSGLFIVGGMMDRQFWTGQDSISEYQVGDLTPFEGGQIRGFRLGAVGTINFERPWIWTAFAATHAYDRGFDSDESDQLSLIDLRLDIPLGKNTAISLGKQKEPISMDRLSGMVYLPMQERAAVSDTLLPARNTGLVINSSVLQNRATLAAGFFNNWLDRDQPGSFGDNSSQWVGRATWAAFVSDNENTIMHLGGGVRHDNAKEPLRTVSRPEFFNAPLFVDTGTITADSTDTWQAELSVRSGPYWLHGEYVRTDVNNSNYGDLQLDGYHITASWMLTGEVRPYDYRMGLFKLAPIARTVNQNGWGSWELGTRFSHIDTNDGALNGGEMDVWSVGLNWWLTPYLTVSVNYRYITLDRFGETGRSHGVNTRLGLMLE